ncbi:MAG: hypothetical protein J6B94_09635 [Lachnospiraceae bacterium]|nr:hypothetical protein [Lachnospiraceae bacterium]
MYLISIYFDQRTDETVSSYMKQIAKHTGNTVMVDEKVPPHITVAAFWEDSESRARKIFDNIAQQCNIGKLCWASVGCFLPHVIYIAPVLNEYLHQLSVISNKEITCQQHVRIEARYQPFQWFPHTTLAKKLTQEEMRCAFEVMQKQFGSLEGYAVKIGLAKTNPYTNLAVFNLNKKVK